MSCCDGCDDFNAPGVRRLTPPANTGRGGFGVSVNGDFTAGALLTQVIVYPPAAPLPPGGSVRVVFPLNPAEGQTIEVVAAGVDVTVDGNTNNVAGPALLASGSAQTWTFARNAFAPDLSQPGTWYPSL